MSEQNERDQAPEPEERADASGCDCPWCSLKEHLGRWSDSAAWGHFSKAQEEFLMGLKSLIDSRLDDLRARPSAKEPRVTKIKVE